MAAPRWAWGAIVALCAASLPMATLSERSDTGSEKAVDAASNYKAVPHKKGKDHRPQTLSDVHPVVNRALGEMDGEMRELDDSAEAVKATQGKFGEAVNHSIAHRNSIEELRHSMKLKEAALRAEEHSLQMLKAEEKQLRRSHDQVSVKLRDVMTPKIDAAEQRLAVTTQDLAKEQQQLANWTAKEKAYKTAALRSVHERRAALQALRESEAELAEAQRKQKEDLKKYNAVKHEASDKVEAFKHVSAEYRAMVFKEKAEEDRAARKKKALEKLVGIFRLERKRLGESLEDGEAKLKRRMKTREKASTKEKKELEGLRKKYTSWTEQVRENARERASKQKAYEESLTNYADKRKEVLGAAEAKVTAQEKNATGWADDDWAWSQDAPSSMEDEADLKLLGLNVSLNV
eukprot:CAMPEP_0170626028 /NCGR_PEP_ID=MMETSP0224-20130122/31110_1 /TAXON_ID=285029 /ORGANISM="Togula jolla, Strain CCCM 725" /LENGTH=404 /DNA_ID=CAMNT_0010952715 /DNA_START=45 /DNA_END=1256 /DNA_ORIENTATION=+